MGNEDKLANKGEGARQGQGVAGRRHSNDRDLQAEGKKDQSKADLKQAGEKVKDAFKN